MEQLQEEGKEEEEKIHPKVITRKSDQAASFWFIKNW